MRRQPETFGRDKGGHSRALTHARPTSAPSFIHKTFISHGARPQVLTERQAIDKYSYEEESTTKNMSSCSDRKQHRGSGRGQGAGGGGGITREETLKAGRKE